MTPLAASAFVLAATQTFISSPAHSGIIWSGIPPTTRQPAKRHYLWFPNKYYPYGSNDYCAWVDPTLGPDGKTAIMHSGSTSAT